MTIRETRTVELTGAEVRKSPETSELSFSGHAAVFGQRTWIGPKRWGFWEVVDPAFFRNVLNDDAAFLVNHDPNIVLARNPTTMKLSVDERGLVADAEWDPADPDAAKWAGRVKRGDVDKMSFAFTVAEESWSEDEESGEETRTLLTAEKLYDASLVTYPAYSGTDGGMRDAAAEVVKRHRGVDPRQAGVTFQPTTTNGANVSLGTVRVATLGTSTGTTPVLNPVAQTEPPPADTPPAAPPEPDVDLPDEPGGVDPFVPDDDELDDSAEDVTRASPSLAVLRHRALAKRHRLTL